MDKVSLVEKLALIEDHWNPRIVGELNGQHVKLVKFKGEFVWHHHEHEDELFLVVAGRFRMDFRDRQVWLAPGESWAGMDRGFTIRLVDFAIPRNERGDILQYRATIELEDPVRGDRSQVVSVNHPLRHAGVSFYQSSYRALDDQVGRDAVISVGN